MSAPLPALVKEKATWFETLKILPPLARIMLRADRTSFVLLFVAAFMELPANALYTLALKGITDAAVASRVGDAWIWVAIMSGVLVWQAFESYISELHRDRMRYKVDLTVQESAMRVVAGQPLSVLESPAYQALYTAFTEKQHTVVGLQNMLVWYAKRLFGILGLSTMFVLLPWQAIALVILFQIALFFVRSKDASYAWLLLDTQTREGRRGKYYERIAMGNDQPLFSRVYDLFPVFQSKWKKVAARVLEKQLGQSTRFARAAFLSQICTTLGFLSGVAFLLPVRPVAVIASVGGLIAFTSAYFRFSQWVASFVTELDWLQQEAPALSAVHRFLSLAVETDAGRPLPDRPLTIEFQDVWFRYPDSKIDVIAGVSCVLTQGEHIALVGLNGAGKSTLLKLLFRVYRPTRGLILVNGQDLWSLRPSAWRKVLAIMTQSIPHFSDTFKEQILYGQYDRGASKVRLAQAAMVSGFGEIAQSFPRKLETVAGRSFAMVEDEAIELSGGQSQLLSIARTLYRDAKLYIFDEPTSAVDAEKEERFFEKLADATPGKTVIFVSHRFSVLRRAARILVMDQGRIIEDGTHEELLAKEGRYAELFALQAKMYQ
jgi:ATP-binding cassette subfamily B protein